MLFPIFANLAYVTCEPGDIRDDVRLSLRVDDDAELRYVPYFGDDDKTGVDVSFYEVLPGDKEKEIVSEVEEACVQVMVHRHGLIAEVRIVCACVWIFCPINSVLDFNLLPEKEIISS